MPSPLARLLVCALAALATIGVLAQTYPSRPIKLVVPLAPGAQIDWIARTFGEALSAAVKQPVVIENHAGAAGTIGANFVAKAPGDGYTLLIGGAFNLSLAPALVRDVPYDPVKDFAPIGGLARVPYALAVRSSVPAKSLQELIAYVRANPGRLSYGSSGVGSSSSLAIEVLKASAGLDILHVPYKGSAPAAMAAVAGEVDMVCMDLALLAPHAQAGSLRLVALAGNKRSPMAPELPTSVEQGVPELVLEPWYGLVAPAAISHEAREKLATALSLVVHSPEWQRRLEQKGYEVIADTPESFGALIRAEFERYARLIEAAKIPRGS